MGLLDSFFGNPDVKNTLKGRTENQQKAILYFLGGDGSLIGKTSITDNEYDLMVRARIAAGATKELALEKLCLAGEQAAEIEPVCLENWYFTSQSRIKRGDDHVLRSSGYQFAWFFFSSAQVHAYQYIFNMEDDTKKTRTEHYFYRDIISFSTRTNTVEYEEIEAGGFWKQPLVRYAIDDEDVFRIVVPGDAFEAAMIQSDYTRRAISAMQNLLRAKKS